MNTLQNITRFHLCVAEWVPGQLSMGPTLFTPVRLSSEECVLQGGEGASCAATGCQELHIQPWQHEYIAEYNSFPFMCGRVGAWAAEHGSSSPVQTCQVVQMKSVSCKGEGGKSVLRTGCLELLSQRWQHKYIAKYNSFPFMCGRVGAWAAEHGSNPVHDLSGCPVKSVSWEGARVQVVAATGCQELGQPALAA